MFQSDIHELIRNVFVYVVLGIFVIYFSSITFQILRRKRQRLNIIFSAFFISIIIANILNMVYVGIENPNIILILNFLTNFFLCFGPVFLFIVNMIILESTIIYSIKRQNKYIIIYGFVAFFGMLILVILGLIHDTKIIEWIYGKEKLETPFLGVVVSEQNIKYGIIFFIYIISISTGFVIIPFIHTSFKIYSSFDTKALKKKWLYYTIGSIGAFSIAYMAFINNLVANLVATSYFTLILMLYGLTIILWGYLMYYGIGYRLKQ